LLPLKGYAFHPQISKNYHHHKYKIGPLKFILIPVEEISKPLACCIFFFYRSSPSTLHKKNQIAIKKKNTTVYLHTRITKLPSLQIDVNSLVCCNRRMHFIRSYNAIPTYQQHNSKHSIYFNWARSGEVSLVGFKNI
jgi:hypothetical protein